MGSNVPGAHGISCEKPAAFLRNEIIYPYLQVMTTGRKFVCSGKSQLTPLAVVLLSLLPFMAGAQGGNGNAGTYILSGILTDEQHKPLDNANILVFSGGVLVGGAKTRKDGRFVIRVPMPVVDLKVVGLGWWREEIQGLQLPIDLRLCLRKKEFEKLLEVGRTTQCGNPFFHPSEPGRKVIYAEDLRHMGY